MTPGERKRVETYLQSLPGQRGKGVPAEHFDMIMKVANGITLPMWGRSLEPHQVQWLHDNEMHTPQDIHAAVSAMPHPHAPSVSVGDYQRYSHALGVYHQHK